MNVLFVNVNNNTMKFIPLLLSTLMVQALPRKKQTRRTKGLEFINNNSNKWELSRVHNGIAKFCEFHNWTNELFMKCPYGKPGDVLWVRETFAPALGEFAYKADYSEYTLCLPENVGLWKPSIHMPKVAARHFLKIKSIIVERLQDISESDAIAEGVTTKEFGTKDFKVKYLYECYTNKEFGFCETARASYFTLWDFINGKDAAKKNPWVWVIEFEQITRPDNFLN